MADLLTADDVRERLGPRWSSSKDILEAYDALWEEREEEISEVKKYISKVAKEAP